MVEANKKNYVKTWSTQAFLNTFTFSRAALLSGMSANTWPIKLFCCYITHCKPHLYRIDKLGFEIVKLFEADLHHPSSLRILRHSDQKFREIRESGNLLLEGAATGMSLLKKGYILLCCITFVGFSLCQQICTLSVQKHYPATY